MLRQLRAKRKLEKALAAHARSSRPAETLRRMQRRGAAVLQKFVLKNDRRKRFEKGGTLVALVGGDGAGKSTCVKEISRWLGKKFQTRAIHLGKPPKSLTTFAIAAVQKLHRKLFGKAFSGQNDQPVAEPTTAHLLQYLRWVAVARDRYRLYSRACRLATNGAVVLCDRFPVRPLHLMDGPKIAASMKSVPFRGLIYHLIELEKWYYHRILPPDLLIVLRVDPETAVRRKTDEPAEHVRPRAAELWKTNWQGTGAHLVDASLELPEVLADLRGIIWKEL